MKFSMNLRPILSLIIRKTRRQDNLFQLLFLVCLMKCLMIVSYERTFVCRCNLVYAIYDFTSEICMYVRWLITLSYMSAYMKTKCNYDVQTSRNLHIQRNLISNLIFSYAY